MNRSVFAQQLQRMHGRLDQLAQAANAPVQVQPELLLPRILKELGTVSEELQVAVEELIQQNEALAIAQATVVAQRQHYFNLFDAAPSAYLVTDELGTIQEANRAAAQLLNVEPQFLIGKPLLLFVMEEEREILHCQLRWVQKTLEPEELIVHLRPRQRELLVASLTVTPIIDGEAHPVVLGISVRKLTEHWQEPVELESNSDLSKRPRQMYAKGEIIPLPSETIWQVQQGLVKLSVMSANGSQVLVGLAGPPMPFGCSLSAQQTYQATALTDVNLVSFSLIELAIPHVAKTLLPHIQQRLQQAESLLAIAGQRHVKERLFCLLQLLKQNFGLLTSQGVRLSVRFTHQDLAEACSTTRVTITRLLCQLQEQGIITYNSKKHIIFLQEITQ